MPQRMNFRARERETTRSADSLARECYDRHGGELYRFALARLGDSATAQDVVQETIVRAWRAAERFDPSRASLRTWLYAIAKNVISDHLASRSRALALAADLTENQEEGAMHDHADAVADADLVRRALGSISSDQRTAIVETYLLGRPYVEVAHELGVSVSTLRSRVFYGLKHLRLAMGMLMVES
ncbi:RNA polymerase sigma factor [Aeromicrobium sp.]|uniref:RNA polymerase sigma factor n=1 Tax=Aeromicrobium sp. TaxID=1871063 RepID=UPI0030BE683D